jgi:NADH-quinone oxidoreductase subunit H
LLERKLLRLSQRRLGPVKVGAWGILQPVLDGMKLFLKLDFELESNHKLLYKRFPILNLITMFFLLFILPFDVHVSSDYQMFWVLIVFGLNSHLLLISG